MTIHVLLVEDDHDLRSTLVGMLTERGFNVTQSENGEVAFTTLISMHVCDVVLLDQQMPVLNGRGFLERIRQYVRFGELPVVAMTAFDDFVPPAGVVRILRKPFTLDHLVEVLTAAASTRHRMSADSE